MSRSQKRKAGKRVHHNYNCKRMTSKNRFKSMYDLGGSLREFRSQGFKIFKTVIQFNGISLKVK